MGNLLVRTNPPSGTLEGDIFKTETDSETNSQDLGLFCPSRFVTMEPAAAYPYRLAKLNDAGGNIKERWSISFYVWNLDTGKLVRKQRWISAKFNSKISRQKEAQRLISKINQLLAKGYVLSKESQKKKEPTKILSWVQAFDWVHEHRKPSLRKRSIQTLELIRAEVRAYCAERGLTNYPLSLVQMNICDDFMQWLRIRREISNATYNNYLTFLKLNFNYLVKRDMMKVNPAAKLPRLKIEEPEQVSFPEQVQQDLLQAYAVEYPELVILVQYIFYSFIRPGELRMLKVKHVGAKTITVPGRIAKNRKTEHVLITPGLEKLLTELKVRSYPPEYALIGHIGKPSKKSTSPNYYTSRHLKIKRDLGLPEAYTLYCWKHTGVTATFLATRDMDFVSRQCRHSSLDMTKRYLRSLGLMLEYPLQDQLPELEF